MRTHSNGSDFERKIVKAFKKAGFPNASKEEQAQYIENSRRKGEIK